MLNFLAMVLLLVATIIGAFGSLFMKKGAEKFNLNPIKQLKNKRVILGILLFVASAVLYIYAIRMEELSVLYPMTSLSYIWVALLSQYFLKEKMNRLKWSGIGLIIVGIIVIAYFA